MPRKRTGALDPFVDASGKQRYRGRIRLKDDSRERVTVPEEHCKTEALARSWVAEMQRLEDRNGLLLRKRQAKKAGSEGESLSTWCDRWIASRVDKGLSSASEGKRRLAKHVLPTLGQKPVKAITRADLEALVDRLDAHVRASEARAKASQRAKGDFGWKTAIHIWSDVSKMFKDACSGKPRDLQVREDNPALGVRGPDRGGKKALQYLWPSEFLAFVSCEAIPLPWRRLLALSTYLYCRPEELEPLDWGDVDFEHGLVHIHRAVDRVRDKGRVKETKTGIARRPPIEPALLPLLRALHKESGGEGKVIEMPPAYDLSRKLRSFLKLAGVTRADLFTPDATRRQINWYHATRSSGLTWCAARGDEPVKMMYRAGHTDFKTTLLYVREAENHAANFGVAFPPLPAALLDVRDTYRATGDICEPKLCAITQENTWAQQDLNDKVGNHLSNYPHESANATPDQGSPNYGEKPLSGVLAQTLAQTALDDALATALRAAATAGRFDLVAQLATELQARRAERETAEDIHGHPAHARCSDCAPDLEDDGDAPVLQ